MLLCRYELFLSGSVLAQPAPPDSPIPGARLRVQLTLQQQEQQQEAAPGANSSNRSSSSSSSSSDPTSSSSGSSSSRDYDSPEAAVAGAPSLSADVAKLVTQALAAEGQGSGLRISEPTAAGAEVARLGGQELQHWLRLVVLRAESAGRQAVAQVAPLSGSGRLEQSFKVRVGGVRVGWAEGRSWKVSGVREMEWGLRWGSIAGLG